MLTEIQYISDYANDFYHFLPEKQRKIHIYKKRGVEIPPERFVSQGVEGDLKVMRSAELKLSFSSRLYLNPHIWTHLEISLNLCYNRPTPQWAEMRGTAARLRLDGRVGDRRCTRGLNVDLGASAHQLPPTGCPRAFSCRRAGTVMVTPSPTSTHHHHHQIFENAYQKIH